MNRLEHYKSIENEEFKGWDFEFLDKYGLMKEGLLPWNYYSLIKKYISQKSVLLDMGTGGGEFLSGLDFLPKNTFATEGYKPNIKIAQDRLGKLGVEVKEIVDDIIPFDDNKFDVIINRHESLIGKEVERVLKDQGVFVSQQVGGENDMELNEILDGPKCEYLYWNLDYVSKKFDDTSMEIVEKREERAVTRFYSIEAIIYYLKAIPWQIEDFSVEKYYDKLVELEELIEQKGYFDCTCHRFYLIARKK